MPERMKLAQIEEAKARYMGKLVRLNHNDNNVGIVTSIVSFSEHCNRAQDETPRDYLVLTIKRSDDRPFNVYLEPDFIEVWRDDDQGRS